MLNGWRDESGLRVMEEEMRGRGEGWVQRGQAGESGPTVHSRTAGSEEGGRERGSKRNRQREREREGEREREVNGERWSEVVEEKRSGAVL